MATDLKTLVNGMEQINASKNLKEIEEVTRREGHGLVAAWENPEFPAKIMEFMMSIKNNKDAKM